MEESEDVVIGNSTFRGGVPVHFHLDYFENGDGKKDFISGEFSICLDTDGRWCAHEETALGDDECLVHYKTMEEAASFVVRRIFKKHPNAKLLRGAGCVDGELLDRLEATKGGS